MRFLSLLLILLLAGCATGPQPAGRNLIVDESPVQGRVFPKKVYRIDDYRVTQLATFQIKAKVLSRKSYSEDRQSELSPVDLVLGWKQMSDDRVLERINISQSGRWYYWMMDRSPITEREVEFYSANMHLIPADPEVESLINQVGIGDIIELRGDLVRVDAADGWRWVSSLSRTDVGANSCELILVKSVQRLVQ